MPQARAGAGAALSRSAGNDRAQRPAQQKLVAYDAASVQPALSADTFVNTIGFNAHFENHYSIYAIKFPQVKSLLTGAGIRHVRVGMVFGNPPFFDMMKQLAGSGIYGSYVTLQKFSQTQIQEYPSLVTPSFESYEAPNEPDQGSNPNWAQDCRTFQQNLYSWVKSNPQTAQYPVIGPSVTKKFTELGDISAYEDYANIHNYLDVFNPDTNGWGGKTPYGVYGSIRYNMNIVRVTSESKPVMSTETGYGATVDGAPTATGRPTLDYRTQLRYMPRLFFEQFNHGISRTYAYEFIDHGGDRTFDHFGVIQTDLTPKPAYTAIKSIIGALQDPGPAFNTTPLQLDLSGDTINVHHTLLEKRNGQYVLAVWLEVPSWNPHGGGDINVPDRQVSIATGKAFSSATISTMDERGELSTKPLQWSRTQGTFTVSDKVSLVTLSP